MSAREALRTQNYGDARSGCGLGDTIPRVFQERSVRRWYAFAPRPITRHITLRKAHDLRPFGRCLGDGVLSAPHGVIGIRRECYVGQRDAKRIHEARTRRLDPTAPS